MTNFNFTILEGFLVKDPEIKTLEGDKTLCKFTIGTNRSYKKRDGERVEEASFFDITTWYKLADSCGKYLTKGKRVLVSGILRKDVWKSDSGETRSKIYLEGGEVNFLSPAASAA